MWRPAILATLLIALFVAVVHAHSGAKGVVKQRMDAMGIMGKSMKSLAFMVTRKQPYDAKQVTGIADVITAHAGDRMTNLFPPKSLSGPSEARAEIWLQWPEFKQLADRLLQDAADLRSTVPSQSALRPAYKQLAKTCSACHKLFRLKQDRPNRVH